MTASPNTLMRKSVAGWLLCLALGMPWLGFLGCARDKLAVRDEGFSDTSLADDVRRARPAKKDIECAGLSNKAQEIERNLGSR